ncbi:hypothetical protein G5S35_03950 [Paraburkholderia tropica]|uniref:hypothetical protein n=1 Tax=Paraburkholderia tropica TaxID=92647 RepID=UPI0016024C5B|nr:hypothetical protein [Paraburkholderia tropica]QNB10809.1 hypothetical protein G5S35_03950 [Paraburkholderia tropica]
MNANKRPNTPCSTTNVLHLVDFREPERPTRDDATQAHAARIRLVNDIVLSRLKHPQKPALAAAAAYIDANGCIGIAAAGIEPEMAIPLADELRALARSIESHATKQRTRPKKQRGVALIGTLIAISFAAATYWNDVAWIDAALSLAAQIAAGYLSKRNLF